MLAWGIGRPAERPLPCAACIHPRPQVANSAQLEAIKDQVVSLKKLCRIRTVKSIKQAHLAALDGAAANLDASHAELAQEVAAMQVRDQAPPPPPLFHDTIAAMAAFKQSCAAFVQREGNCSAGIYAR